MKELIYITDSKFSKPYTDTLNNFTIPNRQISWEQVLTDQNLSNFDYSNSLIRVGYPCKDDYLLENYFSHTENQNVNLVEFENLIKIIEKTFKNGIHPNNLSSLIGVRNKSWTSDFSVQNKIVHPKTTLINSISELENLLFSQKSLFFKPLNGSMGRGCGKLELNFGKTTLETIEESTNTEILTNSHDEIYDFFNKCFSSDLNLIFQEYIKIPIINNKIFDIRVLNVGYKPIFSYARATNPNSLTTNVSNGASPNIEIFENLPDKIKQTIYDLSTNISKKLNLSYVGMDFILSDTEKIYFLEANAFPGLKGPFKFGINPYEHELKYYQKNLFK